jgi:Mrp family chromosome partitioning ATPase
MNAIDRAFIRAYEADEPVAATAAATPRREDASGGDGSGMRAAAPHFRAEADASPTVVRSREVAPGERRPLSAFAAPAQTVEARFKPALEVDGFRWSATCRDLIERHYDRLRPALDALLAADDAGRSLIGVGAPAAGVGCTTVLACLARLLADAGKSVAIVDGNFAAPGLAMQLGLAVEPGWEDVLSGAVPLAEGVVYSLGDRVALLPLVRGGVAAAEKLDAIHASVTAGVLRYHYDMVLFDLGNVFDPVQGPIARRLARQCRLDGVVLTSGLAAANAIHPHRLMQTAPELAAICLGVVENQLRAA